MENWRVFFAIALLFPASAFAALPAELTTALTDLGADIASLFTAVWALVIAVAVGFALFRLAKRGIRAGT